MDHLFPRKCPRCPELLQRVCSYVVHVDEFSVQHLGDTNESSLRVNHKHMEGILVRTDAFQRVVDVRLQFKVRANLKQGDNLIISLPKYNTHTFKSFPVTPPSGRCLFKLCWYDLADVLDPIIITSNC